MVGWKGRTYSFFAHVLPIKMAYKIRYHHWNNKWPNLDKPERFIEKLMWLTRYNELYNKELIQQTYDKYNVREYIKSKGLERILVPQYGRYTRSNQIDFENLPEEYILKSTQSSGQNIIVSKEKPADVTYISAVIDGWISQKKNRDRFQGYYFTDDESIICEELLRDENGSIPTDIRICCCNGKPKWIYCDIDAIDENMNHRKAYYREYFDLEWNYLPIDNRNRVRKNKDYPTLSRPENLEEIVEIAEILSKDFIFVRVDLYSINNKIYFGELTPIPGMAGGFEPDEWDFKFGDMIELPDVKIW